jgi:hypothetical protein
VGSQAAPFDQDDLDAIAGTFDPQGVRGSFEGVLCGLVPAAERRCHQPVDRRHIDDTALSGSAHMPPSEPRESHGRHHHRLELAAHLLVAHNFDGSHTRVAGIVDQRPRTQTIDDGAAALGVGDIEDDRVDVHARSGRGLGEAGRVGPRSGPAHGIEPEAGEMGGRRQTDARVGPGGQHRLSYVCCHVSPSCPGPSIDDAPIHQATASQPSQPWRCHRPAFHFI